MLTNHRRRLHNDGTLLPIIPDRRQPGLQESISGRQFRSLHRPSLQITEFMTKGKNPKLKCPAIAKESQESRRQRDQVRQTSESRTAPRPFAPDRPHRLK